MARSIAIRLLITSRSSRGATLPLSGVYSSLEAVIMASITHIGSAGLSAEHQDSKGASSEEGASGAKCTGLEESLQRLKDAGFRLTPQRRAILEIFHDGAGHLTPQQVFATLDDVVPSLSLATVYNTLELLEEIGLLTRVTAHDGQTYFDPTVVPHHHALCDKCGDIFDVFLKPGALDDLIADAEAFEGANPDFRVTQATVWLRGRCRSCQH